MITRTPTVDADFIDQLLALPDVAQRIAKLATAGLLSNAGLTTLLGTAAQLVRDDPARGRQLAELCADLAEQAQSPLAAPRARYIQAQAYAINAEYEAALALIDAAESGYTALGETYEALRTSIGRMNVLKELGRYHEALDRGQAVIDTLGEADTTAEARMLIAMAHQNRGRCYEQMGLYDEALHAYDAAERGYLALALADRLGEISNNRGIVLLGLGRGSQALAAFEQAAATFAASELTVLHADALLNCGNAHLQLGQYHRALAVFEQARRLLITLDAQADKAVLLLDTAAAYLALNLYPEALTAYRQAEHQLGEADMLHDQARALWGMGSALLASGQLAEAEATFDRAMALFAQTGNTPLLAGVMLEQAALQAGRDEQAAALSTAQRALALVAQDNWPVEHIYAHMRLADLLLPDVTNAEAHLRAATRMAATVTMPHLRYRLDQRYGHLRLLQGRDAEAERRLLAAAEAIEQLRGALAHEAFRVSFLRDKAAVYEDLLRLYLRRGDPASYAQAFDTAERAKSRALVDLLSSARQARPAGELLDGEALRLRTLQADLHAIYDELLGGMVSQRHRVDAAELRMRAVELEQEISRLRLQTAATATTPEGLAAPLSLDIIQSELPRDTALIAYHIVGDELVAFVCVDGLMQSTGLFGSAKRVQALLQRLEVQWDRIRAGYAFAAQHTALLEQSARRVLELLYDELFSPLRPLLDGAGKHIRRLAIAPHGLLHRVPFHALYGGTRYLLEAFEIAYAPSATVLTLCRRRAPRREGRALVLGVADSSIPAVAREVAAVAERLAGASVYLDEQATVARLRAEAPSSDTIHLACHGLFRDDNPAFSGLKLADGWLTAGDALDLDLDGTLVTLSACESGRGQAQSGDEIVGLTRAFLGAGAATLVASLWLAHDATTADLTAMLYDQLRGGSETTTALRAAQLALKARQPHPFFWAPFVVVGRW
jgi:CHAT domain-containing protein/tetratricopeptide (TPR) repeat protein